MTQEELIKERQEKVSSLLMTGHTEVAIAKMLGVSRETIVRDVRELKNMSPQWIDSLAQYGFIFEFKLFLDLLKSHRVILQDMLENSSSTLEKLKIIRQIQENIEYFRFIMLEGPTLYALNKKLNDLPNVNARTW